jgi:CheY-like chemotaxis protein
MRILIADDGSETRLILSRFLRKWGHDVIVTKDGLAAWHMLQQEQVSSLINGMNRASASLLHPQYAPFPRSTAGMVCSSSLIPSRRV